MKNPAAIKQPELKSPIGTRQERKKRQKGNLPYLKYRRNLRRNILS